MNGAFFGDMLQSISDRGRKLLDRRLSRRSDSVTRSADFVVLCEDLLSGRGEASGVALAREILNRYATLTTGPRIAFFEALAQRFGPDRERMEKAIAAWQANPTDATAARGSPRRRAAPAGTVPPAQSGAGRHRGAGAHARATARCDGASRRSVGRGCRFRSPVLVVVQPRLPGAAQHRLVDAGQHPGKDHQARGRAQDPQLGRSARGASIRRTAAASPSSIRR